MREIKFRQPLWLKGKFSRWHYWGFVNDGFTGPAGDLDKSKEESQQHAGLHDKKGKPIFEGDLWKWKSKIYPVTWEKEQGAFGFSFQYEDGEEDYYDLSVSEQGEIIGNIYEDVAQGRHRGDF